MSAPLVSIVTPCLNSGRFLASCLASVQAQDYPHVEHVVQDGCSTDGSVDLLREAPENVTWVSEPDRGQADALDRALRRSRGDILLVLNADDELLPGAARWGVEQMRRYPAHGVIYGDLYLIDEDGTVTGECHGPTYDFASIFCVERIIPAQAAFIRRMSLEAVGLHADISLDTCPDYEMFVRLGLRFPMRHVPGFVARYRIYHRPMDGTAPRTVARFVHAKSTVMERVRGDPETPASIRKLSRRARAGLYLWASEEARAGADTHAARHYYADAIAEFGPTGSGLARLIRWQLRWVARRPPPAPRETAPMAPSVLYPHRPNVRRALAVGKGLVWEWPGVGRLARIVAAARRVLLPKHSDPARAVPPLVHLILLVTLLYLLVTMICRR